MQWPNYFMWQFSGGMCYVNNVKKCISAVKFNKRYEDALLTPHYI